MPEHCAHAKGTVILRHRRRRVRNQIYLVTRAGGIEHPATPHILEALRA